MSYDPHATQPIAGWFKPAAIASAAFMALGVFSYLIHVYADRSELPLDQRALFEAEPWWMTGAYAIAVWSGLAGAVLLVLRRNLAVPLLLVSLVATIIWFAAFFLVRNLRLNMSSDELAMPAVVLVLTWTITWFARHSRQRGWLR